MGNGIYVGVSGTGTLTLAPSDAGAISFGENDAIYLPNSAGTVAGQVSFNINAPLNTGIIGNVPLELANPQIDATVAIALTNQIATQSVSKLKSGTIIFDVDGVDIYIRSLQRII
jgi:hypothetical protein